VLGWFAAVFAARMPRGLQDAGMVGLQYAAQMAGYLVFLTDRYPDADPRQAPASAEPAVEHPVRLEDAGDDLRRPRLLVLFRLLLALPHIVWLLLWAVLSVLAALANGLITLVRGRPARPLHRFLSAYVRYATHVSAFLLLAANPFPGFTGKPGQYPLDVHVAGAQDRQNRWSVLGRFLLIVPAWLMSAAIGGAAYLAAFLGWWVALFLGRMPRQLRELEVWSLRYGAQVTAYFYMLTGRYPHASPHQ
jgi:hypothetical protein